MFCIACGKEQPNDAAFCPFCGTKHPVISEDAPQLQPNEVASLGSIAQNVQQPTQTLDFPAGDVEPIFIVSDVFFDWTFRYNNSAVPPPEWASRKVDAMFTERHVFFQAQLPTKMTVKEYVKGLAAMVGVTTAVMVPIIGATVGLGAALYEGITPKKNKHPGYGSNNQFSRDSLIQMFSVGKGMWANRQDCEFRTAKAWRLGKFLDTHYYFTIIGEFHNNEGVRDLAAFAEISPYGDTYRDDLLEKTGCVVSRDDKFKVRSEALRSLENYPEPPITTKLDD